LKEILWLEAHNDSALKLIICESVAE